MLEKRTNSGVFLNIRIRIFNGPNNNLFELKGIHCELRAIKGLSPVFTKSGHHTHK